jgi:hypothetical protein
LASLLVIVALAVLSSCDNGGEHLAVQKPVEKAPTKWKIETQGYFTAGYGNNPREILIITSPKGQRFLAITGCGVTELHEETVDNNQSNTVEE